MLGLRCGGLRVSAKGTKLGRPKVSSKVENAILQLRYENKGIRKIARELGIGVSTVQRVVHEQT